MRQYSRVFLVAFVILSFFAAFARTCQAQINLADVIDRCEKSVVRIEVKGLKGEGLGSGFVVESSGLLVTNVHVLAGADQAEAFFADGKSFNIEGTYLVDVNRDICVAKMTASDLSAIALAERLPRKGEQVVALGSPHGLSFSATRGIVSAIRDEKSAKSLLGRENIEGTWIQVDAALSGGNSGGPLINMSGEVVGMSTLASQGAAQNLNFGISVMDVRVAIKKAQNKKLMPLKAGVGKIDLDGIQPKSSAIISRDDIPTRAIEEYMEKGRAQYAQLSVGLRKAATEAETKLKEMRKGQTYIPSGGGSHEVVIQKFRRVDKYFFRNESVKDRVVSKQRSLVNRLREVKKNLKRELDDTSLFTLLMNGGPRLDPRNSNSIGFMAHGKILHAFNEHDVIVIYDNAPYLMWVKSTAGLSMGQEAPACPVYVAGTRTVQVPKQGTLSLTILNSVTETEISEVVFGKANQRAAPKFQTWTDSTGKFKIEAVFVEVDVDSKVVLKKRDGSVVRVPLNKLSKEDALRVRQK